MAHVSSSTTSRFAEDVHDGLTALPRQIPARYLYDALGSRLFEAIGELPWYRITRAERALLGRYGSEVASLTGPTELVELGSGDGEKTAIFLRALRVDRPRVHLIDISTQALEQARRALEPFEAWLTTEAAEYQDGIRALPPRIGDDDGTRLMLFFGSNIGNFDPPAARALLRLIRSGLREADALLVGIDLVKSESALQLAYDDPLGITAAFNRNLLVRINRELGAAIPIDAFSHRAVWNAVESRVEMHLVATHDVRLSIPAARVDETMRAGETIWTESSYKFEIARFREMAESTGFRARAAWEDAEARFALVLLGATAP